MADDAVNASPVLNVLTQSVDAIECLNDGVKRVDAFLRRSGSVRRLAMKCNLHFRDSQAAAPHHSVASRMEHHGHINFFEQACVDHHYLAAATLFCWSPEED